MYVVVLSVYMVPPSLNLGSGMVTCSYRGDSPPG